MVSTLLTKLESRIGEADFNELPLEKALAIWVKYNEMFLSRDGKVMLGGEFDFATTEVTTQWSG